LLAFNPLPANYQADLVFEIMFHQDTDAIVVSGTRGSLPVQIRNKGFETVKSLCFAKMWLGFPFGILKV